MQSSAGQSARALDVCDLRARVTRIVAGTPITDIHTHLYDPAFGDLVLWGIDDLLTYHYLVSESFRYLDIPYKQFWALNKTTQADLIWDALFVQHSPISEACRGVLTVLNRLGLDVKQRDLPAVRRWFAAWKREDYVNRCMELANVQIICMTNSPFDDAERPLWESGFARDKRFKAALRIDFLLVQWDLAVPFLQRSGYDVTLELSSKTLAEIQRFLRDWAKRLNALFVMVSLPPDFAFPSSNITSQLIEKAVVPFCRESGLPFAMMMGVKRGVNAQLQMAGDGMGKADIVALERMLQAFPDVKFLVTMLARENQHELVVLARKYRTLHPFGCWWFLNVPQLIDEITRMRLELLGFSMTPQHSDARVIDQIIYKWDHSKATIAAALADKYLDLAQTGWLVSDAEIERDARDLFGGSFERFLKLSL